MGVSSIGAFFGKFKAGLKGETAQKSKAVEKKGSATIPIKRRQNETKGAFGGTGTGRGRRGMPGRKLIRSVIEAGWKAQKRVMPMGGGK